ncbi:POK8 protein, partial [Herpetotheres cachinnans]|nr:POK8 protein [Herpetotheres cachinnans]
RGQDACNIVVPLWGDVFEWSFANSTELQLALTEYKGSITYHVPGHQLMQLAQTTELRPKAVFSKTPVQGVTVFTDGSGKTQKAVATWQQDGIWHERIENQPGLPQVVELAAVALALQEFKNQSFNLVTDSAYVAKLLPVLERSLIMESQNKLLFNVLRFVWELVRQLVHWVYVLHVRSHTQLPGFIVEGNARADKLASPALAPPISKIIQARESHAFFHQNAKALKKQFSLSHSEARSIIAMCPDCQNATGQS